MSYASNYSPREGAYADVWDGALLKYLLRKGISVFSFFDGGRQHKSLSYTDSIYILGYKLLNVPPEVLPPICLLRHSFYIFC